MVKRRYSGPQSIPLLNQAGALKSRYPEGKVIRRSSGLMWWGRLTPAEYSDTYEVSLDHQAGKPPIVYIARPELHVVQGKQLPHVFPLNTLCLHTLSPSEIAARLFADTLIPWTSEWLFFYELWLANGGTWGGGGVHIPPRPHRSSTSTEKNERERLREERLNRLMATLATLYGPDEDLSELLYNTRVGKSRGAKPHVDAGSKP